MITFLSATLIYSQTMNITGTIYYGREGDIYKMDLASGTEQFIYGDATGHESAPIVSPDGTQIAFSSNANSSGPQLWIMDIDGSNATEITGTLDHVKPTDWIGNNILLSVYEPYGSGRSVWYYDSTNFNEVYYMSGKDTEPSRSWLSEEWIITGISTRYGGNGGSLLKISVDGSAADDTLWSDNVAIAVANASISHDQTKVVFQYTTGSSSNSADLYIYNLVDSTVTPLVTNGSLGVWSPDDNEILFHRDGNLWLTDLSGNTQQFTTDGISRVVYSWLLSEKEGLVAYYPFNGNANDESGNGYDGDTTGHAPTLTTDRFGNENSAFHFDGINDYIEIPVLFDGDQDPISFIAWAMVPTAGSQNGTMFCETNGYDQRNQFKLHGNSGFSSLTFDQYRPAGGGVTDLSIIDSTEFMEWHQVGIVKNQDTVYY